MIHQCRLGLCSESFDRNSGNFVLPLFLPIKVRKNEETFQSSLCQCKLQAAVHCCGEGGRSLTLWLPSTPQCFPTSSLATWGQFGKIYSKEVQKKREAIGEGDPCKTIISQVKICLGMADLGLACGSGISELEKFYFEPPS